MGKSKISTFTSNAIKTGMKTIYIGLANHSDCYFIHLYLSQPCVPGTDDSLRAISNLELVEDIGNIVVNRFGAKRKLAGYLGI